MHYALRAVADHPAFRDASAPYALLDTDLRIRAVNDAFVAATRRERAGMVDEVFADAFPDNPAVPSAHSVRNLAASFDWVLDSARPHSMRIQRYDVERVRGSGAFVEKTWSPVNLPVLDERGRVAGIVHHVEDLTTLTRLATAGLPATPDAEPEPWWPRPTPPPARVPGDRESARLREALIAVVSARAAVGDAPAVVQRRHLWRAVCDRAGDADWRGWPHALCTTAVATLPVVDGAAIALHGGGLQQPLAASDARATELEHLQYTLGEGPSITAFTEGLPVLATEMSAERTRWPGYAPAVAAAGVTGVWAFPVVATDAAVGALTFYLDGATPVGTDVAVDAGVLAELAGVALLADQDRIATQVFDPAAVEGSFGEVSIAVGMTTVQLGLPAPAALSALRARAFATGRTLADLARDVVGGRIRLDWS